jgi:predicted nucleic acid-binding protein
VAEVFVLDTSAWLTLDEAEEGAAEVEAILSDAWLGLVEVHSSFVSLTELAYIRTQERNAEQAEELVAFARNQPVTWHHSDDDSCREAANLKAAHRISFADSFVAALTTRLNATLVHKDPEFAVLSQHMKQRMLPPKK